MKRRTFIQNIGFSTGILGFCALPYGFSRLLFPPVQAAAYTRIALPGALKNKHKFIEACIGCGLCGEVCPPRCIMFHSSDNRNESNTPYINPEVKGCTLCGYCMEACPTEALTVTPIREIDMGIAQIDRVACYPWVDKGICGACASICPIGEQAIDFEFGHFYRPLIKEGCVGCGLCVEVCPEPSLPIRIVSRAEEKIVQHKPELRP